jgi:DNA-binding MarR family transcriptional regulator
MARFTNMQLSDHQWQILRYLYNKEYDDSTSEIDDIITMLSIDRPKALLTVADMMNHGLVSHIVDVYGRSHYVISLEGFTMMQSAHRA